MDPENENAEAEEPKKELTRSEDLDQALAKAVAATSGEATEEATPEKEEAKAAPEVAVVEEEVEPPAEFSGPAKEAWKNGDRKAIRAEWDRINHSRLGELSRLQNEDSSFKGLVKELKPYIEAAGLQGKSPQQAVMEALALANELKNNPLESVRNIIKVAKLNPDSIFSDDAPQKNVPDENFTALQKEVEALRLEREQERLQVLGQHFGAVFQSLAEEKNKAGTQRYLDLQDTEAGFKLASEIGSLIRKPDFQQAVRSRIPGAGLREFVVEAYRWFGGRVDESESSRSQQNSNHVQKAKRAASSVPARGGGNGGGSRKQYGDLESALHAAWEELKD